MTQFRVLHCLCGVVDTWQLPIAWMMTTVTSWPVFLIPGLSWFWALAYLLYGSVPCLSCPCGVVDTWQLLGPESWPISCMAQFLACIVPTVSWTPECGHLAWLRTAVACGLAPSSCTSTPWVVRYRVTEVWLPHPWSVWVLNLSLLAGWLSSGFYTVSVVS